MDVCKRVDWLDKRGCVDEVSGLGKVWLLCNEDWWLFDRKCFWEEYCLEGFEYDEDWEWMSVVYFYVRDVYFVCCSGKGGDDGDYCEKVYEGCDNICVWKIFFVLYGSLKIFSFLLIRVGKDLYLSCVFEIGYFVSNVRYVFYLLWVNMNFYLGLEWYIRKNRI